MCTAWSPTSCPHDADRTRVCCYVLHWVTKGGGSVGGSLTSRAREGKMSPEPVTQPDRRAPTQPGSRQDVMRQGKLLRSDALTCGPPKLDDDCSTPSLCPISSYFYRVPRRACMQGRLLYADGEAYMYMLSAHQQIEPARPPITSRQAKNQGKRASRGQGAWSFARRGPFQNSS